MALSDYIISGSNGTGANGKLYKEIDSTIPAETRSIIENL